MTQNDELEGCRYVVGELKSGTPWHYCGATQREGSSYCENHHAICYYRLRRRVRVERNAVTTAYYTDTFDDAA